MEGLGLMKNNGMGVNNATLLKIEPNIQIESVQSNRVIIKNAGQFPQPLVSWSIRDGSNKVHLPKHTVLAPGKSITVTFHTTAPTLQLYGRHNTLIDEYIVTLPRSTLLAVPFTSQAPFGNWASPFNEACEEAVLVMAQHYRHSTPIDATAAKQEILNIVHWENQTYGYNEDTSAAETAQTAHEYLGLSATVSYDVTVEAIKRLLSEDKLILAPVFGKQLNNPHFIQGGPYYHMILIIGYEGDQFITHDPGTKHGEQYRYSSEILINAIHDLTNPERNMAEGQPTIIIID
jgi:hypothetical protein